MNHWIIQLQSFERLAKRGKAVLITIEKPSPWYGSKFILDFHASGFDEGEIANRTGYSLPVIRRTLFDKGEHPQTGPLCVKYANRVFTLLEAESEAPLPCKPDCICEYRIKITQPRSES